MVFLVLIFDVQYRDCKTTNRMSRSVVGDGGGVVNSVVQKKKQDSEHSSVVSVKAASDNRSRCGAKPADKGAGTSS